MEAWTRTVPRVDRLSGFPKDGSYANLGGGKMIVQSWVPSCSAAFLLFIGYTANTSATDASIDPAKAQITVLYDAFGQGSAMQKDWGYAALIEYGGKRILFDTGNNPDILAQNRKAKDDAHSKLDFCAKAPPPRHHNDGLTHPY